MAGKTTFGIVIREGTSRYYIVKRVNGKVVERYGFNWGFATYDDAAVELENMLAPRFALQ